MMHWKTLAQFVLPEVPAACYRPAAGKQSAIHSAHIYNPATHPESLIVYLVPLEGQANDKTQVVQLTVPAERALAVTDLINLKVAPPYQLYGQGSGMTFTLTGVEADIA